MSKATAIAAALCALALAAHAQNIVLVVADDHGADAGCYGDRVVRTPNLDRLAREGVVFDRAFATTASCSASRSVILSGLHNHRNGQYGHQHAFHRFRTRDDVVTLPVALAKAGYRTARIGKFHVGPPEVYAFETVLSGNARNPVQMAVAVREFVRAGDERPFFLYFCTADPHRSGSVRRDREHAPNAFGNRAQGYPGVESVRYDPAEIRVPGYLPDTPTARAELAEYYESVSRVDQGLGKLLAELEDAGVADRTLVVYTSDHGAAFPGAKTTTYEPGLRVPLVVRRPGQSDPGSRRDALVSLVDLTPTLLDYAGAEPQDSHGTSFLPVLERADAKGASRVYASHTFHEITMYYPMRVVRTERYKLIWNLAYQLPFPFATDLWAAPTWQEAFQRGPDARYGPRTVDRYLHRPEFELYDVVDDPWEGHDLARDPAYAERLAELEQELREFQQRTGDPWIIQWNYRAAARGGGD